jgi:hypothetical protein
MAALGVRQIPILGGIAAWQIPFVTATLCLGALAVGILEGALAVGLLGFVAHSLLRARVVEISPVGLTRGFVLNRRFVGPTTVMPWDSIVSVHTQFRRPGDDTALSTTVRDGAGHAIHFTTAMGLGTYWRCLATVADGAVMAQRSGLTTAVLADRAPDGRSMLAAAATAGVLALVMVAVVGMHYLWAQGRSSFARQLEQSTAERSSAPALRER